MYRYINGIVITYVRARPCATNREESYPKKVAHGPKSLSRYNDIVVSHIVIKGFYCTMGISGRFFQGFGSVRIRFLLFRSCSVLVVLRSCSGCAAFWCFSGSVLGCRSVLVPFLGFRSGLRVLVVLRSCSALGLGSVLGSVVLFVVLGVLVLVLGFLFCVLWVLTLCPGVLGFCSVSL